jgi:hypothetical protein
LDLAFIKEEPEKRPGQAQELTLTHRKVLSALAHLHAIGLKKRTHQIFSINNFQILEFCLSKTPAPAFALVEMLKRQV